jgi:adenine-specific DNA-methyltransferase
MTETGTIQRIPTGWTERETLREKGQFWTPPWLARVMARWVTEHNPETLFDPAVGPGTFFSAARDVGFAGSFDGFELHEATFEDGSNLGLTKRDFDRIIIGDFISESISRSFPAIVSNPPYIRHHRLGEDRKIELRRLAKRVLGFALDGRAGLHVYFLLKCLEHLAASGRLAFLLPADVCEGVSSKALWKRLCERFRLDAVLTFEENAAPFPNVDTNAMVFFMSHSAAQERFKWLRAKERDPAAILKALDVSGVNQEVGDAVICHDRKLAEGLMTGLSRPPRLETSKGVSLSNFARVVRGIATGANEFFFMTSDQRESAELDVRFFIRAIGRTRDCREDVVTPEILERLEREGRPTWLLNLDNTPKERLPKAVKNYIETGERLKLNDRALIQSRRPWYKMEQRTPPPILFAYLGRRDCRFILNKAGVVPLTGFLCVYPKDSSAEGAERLWRALNHPDTLANLAFVGKSYGGGALKVEPRQLDSLEIPHSVLRAVGLESPSIATELLLFEEPARYGHKAKARKKPARSKQIVYHTPPK